MLKVEGWLSGSDVDLLSQEGTRLLEVTESLVLDLSDIRFIDPAGIALLKGWVNGQVELHTESAFVRSLLEANGLV